MTDEHFSIDTLESLTLSGSGLRRSCPVPKEIWPEGFGESFDWTTLAYDVLDTGSGVVLLCPKLRNLKKQLQRASIVWVSSEGEQAAPIGRIVERGRHDLVWLGKRPQKAHGIRVTLAEETLEAGLSRSGSSRFKGLNASMHMSKNNRLEWIADWTKFHIAEHGLEAMLLLDNGSTEYSAEALLDTLGQSGLKAGVVLKVPQSYGPTRTKRGTGGANYLHASMFNLARLRYLGSARAVLQADIDELVWSDSGSVFDRTVASRLGYLTFRGTWTRPEDPERPDLCHSDHRFFMGDTFECPPKYCIRPGGPLDRNGWEMHKAETWAPLKWLVAKDAGYDHCRLITTNWKKNRLGTLPEGREDPKLTARLDRIFGPDAAAHSMETSE